MHLCHKTNIECFSESKNHKYDERSLHGKTQCQREVRLPTKLCFQKYLQFV